MFGHEMKWQHFAFETLFQNYVKPECRGDSFLLNMANFVSYIYLVFAITNSYGT